MRKETKATKIPEKVKKAVWERDGGRCIVCLRPGNPWCHFIPRSQGGLGIEENIVTLCDKCHNDFDQTEKQLRKKFPFGNFSLDFSRRDSEYHRQSK